MLIVPALFIPQDFVVPKTFDCQYFHFRVLEDTISELDYEAVMSSHLRLQGMFGSQYMWPKSDMTLDENTESLRLHKQEFESHVAFAYSVFNSAKNRCLGSIYIDPSQLPQYDCVVYFWIRDDSLELESALHQAVLNWLQEQWPFSKIVFPGRSLSLASWEKELISANNLNRKVSYGS
ncbi:hypothetical protein [Shewanella sp. 10N.286.54.B9]|uniref:hypothetical protein n=1 Tax=Shewanella sp. 10N.286.54.B9 TaxID=3229719 RepID=UPI003550090E